jgi:hypothetical protein
MHAGVPTPVSMHAGVPAAAFPWPLMLCREHFDRLNLTSKHSMCARHGMLRMGDSTGDALHWRSGACYPCCAAVGGSLCAGCPTAHLSRASWCVGRNSGCAVQLDATATADLNCANASHWVECACVDPAPSVLLTVLACVCCQLSERDSAVTGVLGAPVVGLCDALA